VVPREVLTAATGLPRRPCECPTAAVDAYKATGTETSGWSGARNVRRSSRTSAGGRGRKDCVASHSVPVPPDWPTRQP
jgi:hypothetical protein